jgi:hypothetical protein
MENQEIEIVKYMMTDERLEIIQILMKHVLMKYNIEKKMKDGKSKN